MALQTSGQISLNDLHVEAGGTTGTQASMNDTDIRGLISKSSGAQMSFSEWYGASNSIVMQVVSPLIGSISGVGSNYIGFVGPEDLLASSYFGLESNQGSLADTSLASSSEDVVGMTLLAYVQQTQPPVKLVATGSNSNSGWTSLTMSAYGSNTVGSPSGPVTTTRTWTGTFNRSDAIYMYGISWGAMTDYREWYIYPSSGDHSWQILKAAASTSNNGAGVTLTWT
jgi:hypothetical protein